MKKINSQSKTDEYIGCRIRKSRQLLHITQQQLAAILGVSFQQVQHYESGVNGISAVRLFAICEILNVPLESMFPP
jgi:transcriptional regulator with XRE-family HTH domain